MKIQVKPRSHPRYKFEVVVPSKFFGKRIRKPFKTKSAALEEKLELEQEYARQKLAPLDRDYHLCAARFQKLLTVGQMQAALDGAVEQAEYDDKSFIILAEEFKALGKRRYERGAIGKLAWKDIRLLVPRLINWIGDIRARDITKDSVEDWVDDRVSDGYAPKTIKNFADMFSYIMNHGIEDGCVSENPVAKVSLPKGKGKMSIMKPDELQKLLDTATAQKSVQPEGAAHLAMAWVMFGAFGGLRTSEIRRLRWENIRLEEGQLFVPPHAGTGEGKTSHAVRWVVLTPPLLDYCERMMPRKGSVLQDLGDTTLAKKFYRLQDDAGVNIPRNALRHSFGSHHLQHHDKPQSTAVQMGHHSPQVTFDHYREAVTKSQAGKYWDIRVAS